MSTRRPGADGWIRVRDARTHNLRGVDVDLPRGSIIACTGVSGSGKSSLAFDTINAEAQRRYLESIAPFARRLLHQAIAPKVGTIDGLPPAVALQQRRAAPGARSSVGTLTTTSNLLRMLFARAGSYPADLEPLDSDAFSPNTAAGACPACHGTGTRFEVTEQSLVPDPSLSIRERAVAAWPGAWQGKNYRDILAVLGHDVDAPWHTLPQADRDWILFTDEQPVVTVHAEREAHRIQRPYQGTYMSAKRYVLKALTMSQSAQQRTRALEFVETRTCDACAGTRLAPAALRVTLLGRTIVELGALPLRELAEALRPVACAGRVDEDPGAAIATDLVERLESIDRLGLGHLALDRPVPTISTGEAQRLRLATQLRSGLFGVLYVLDEPAAGLHPADAEPLFTLLEQLRDAGNTVLLVEHDLALAARADWLVDVGPGAGEQGGRIVHAGPPSELPGDGESATGRWLAAPRGVRSQRRTPHGWIELDAVACNNLGGVDVRFPTGVLTVVTGVSGSGKSSLVATVLTDVARRTCEAGAAIRDDDDAADAPIHASAYTVGDARGLGAFERVLVVDQRPIGRTPRSNLATYTGLFDAVRKLFADTDEARRRGYKPGRFSFNVDGGRCATCSGEGFVEVELMFLPGTYRTCENCHGARYNAETLEVQWAGRSIADVLALTVDEAREVFAEQRGIERSLRALRDVGLGYVRLGQPATELSGGEAQRIKLATELQRARRGRTLHVLDEPTIGLHPADADLLLNQLEGLVERGDTVVLVEHDMSVVARADHVIELGPGAGADGGRVVATGTPESIAAHDTSRTAPHLAAELAR